MLMMSELISPTKRALLGGELRASLHRHTRHRFSDARGDRLRGLARRRPS